MADEARKVLFEMQADYSKAIAETEKYWAMVESRAAKANIGGGGGGRKGLTDEERAAKAAAQEAAKAAKETERMAQAVLKITDRLNQSKSSFAALDKEAAQFNTSTREGAQALAQIYAAQAKQLGVQRSLNQGEKERAELLRQQIALENKAAATKKLAGARETGYQPVYKRDELQYTRAASAAADAKATGSFGNGLMGAAGKLSLFAAGAAAATNKLNQMGDKFAEFSREISDKGGRLDQAAAKEKANKDKETFLGLSGPAEWWEDLKKTVKGNFDDLLIAAGGKSQADKVDDTLKNATFKGADKKQLDSLLRGRAELESDLARQQMDLERNIYQQRRDLALEGQKLDEEYARKKRDLAIEGEKMDEDFSRKKRDQSLEESKAAVEYGRKQEDNLLKRQRLEEDNALKLQRYGENFAGQMSKARYDLDRQMARRDRSIDKQRNREDYNRTVARDSEDLGTRLQDMQLGGATAVEYYQTMRDYQIQQRRKAEDFSTGEKRKDEDFANQEKDAAAKRNLEVMQEEYDRRYELIEITREYARSLQDLSIETKRQAEDRAMQLTEFENKRNDLAKDESFARRDYANKQSDLAKDEAMARKEYANKLDDQTYSERRSREDFAINAYRSRRSSEEGLADFAGQIMDKWKDNAMSAALLKNAGLQNYANWESQRRGEAPLDFNATGQSLQKDAQDRAASRFGNLPGFGVLAPAGNALLAGLSMIGLKTPSLYDVTSFTGLGGLLSGSGASGGSFDSGWSRPPSPQQLAGGAGGNVSIAAPSVVVNGGITDGMQKQINQLQNAYIDGMKDVVTYGSLNRVLDTRGK